MSATEVFCLPDVGEGLTEAEIVRWRVAPGDDVDVNDTVVEIETAKAVVELPCPFGGRVAELLVPEGQVVPVGTPILAVSVEGAEPAAQPVEPAREAVLVGYGVAAEHRPRRRLTPRSSAPSRSRAPRGDFASDLSEKNVNTVHMSGRVRAKPPVRALAREWGIDLADVAATGPHGDVTRADLLAHREAGVAPTVIHPGQPRRLVAERVSVRGVRRAMADAMVRSVAAAPHVTEWMDVDVSGTVALVEAMRSRWPDLRPTPLAVVAAAVVHAVHRVPMVNASWIDGAEPHIAVHGHLNLGIAVASDRGLLVPNVKDADTLGLRALVEALAEVTERARAGRLTPADSTGGTVTITNVGVFGVDGGTPILNPGEAAILAVGRILDRPWAVDGQVVVRPVMQLSLSFDHRIVDGAAGSRFLAAVAAFLADPATALALA